MSAMTLEEVGYRLPSVIDAKGGAALRARRERLGMSARALEKEAHVNRATIAAAEAGESVRPSSLRMIEAALARLEDEMSGPYDRKGEATSTVELPSGERVTFAGPSDDVVIDLVEKFLARQRKNSGLGD